MLAESKSPTTSLWDKIGVAAASVCAIHCLLLPVVLMALPWLEGIFPHAWFHALVLGITIPMAILAFYHGQKQHHTVAPAIWASIGIIGLISGILMHETPMAERVLSLTGSFLLLVGHAKNIRRCRCHHDHEAGHFCRDKH